MSRKRRVIVSVINDLATDQRVARSCSLLHEMGFEVVLVGRRLKDSLPVSDRPYSVHRMKLSFRRGPLFYMEYNIRLFLFLLTHRKAFLFANDLDTLLPNFMIHKLFGIPLIYDSHEYFTGVPELEGRKVVQHIWKSIERWTFPKLRHVVTVNRSIADLYDGEYGVLPVVVRNVPVTATAPDRMDRLALGLPEKGPLLIMQGSGINVDRGAEEALLAMQHIEEATLLIIGGGDVLPRLNQLAREHALDHKLRFFPRMPHERLRAFTACADLGLTLDKGSNVNYRLSLPNKLFDYIHAGIPVLASDLPEVAAIVKGYGIGEVLPDHQPQTIARVATAMLNNGEGKAKWKENLIIAKEALCWEKERESLRILITQAYGE